ncbi:nurim homolog [Plakobranchus ocellatus]|uniref:Nuclear envelope membrane protein n=1 Tax=Plakobranchus ocellatus TaxID=259542 RepID=A0AAV4CEZ0_9GAST|nr:nurim homolog [Plakobranchus ocellatus]
MAAVLAFGADSNHLFRVLLALTAVGNFQILISKQTFNLLDKGSSVLVRFMWDGMLLIGFMIQHSQMATPRFKGIMESWLNITVSQRLIYTLVSSSALLLCVLKWQSIPEYGLWIVDTKDRWYLWLLFFLLHVLAWFLWGLQLMLMDISEMLGISQVHCHYRSQPKPLTRLKSAHKLLDLYSRLRHPGAFLVTLLLLLHPVMSLDRVLLACWFSCYLIYRHSLTDTHYTFAEKHFTKSVIYSKHSASRVMYDYVED